MRPRRLAKLVLFLVLAGIIAALARYAPRLVSVPENGFVPPSFVTHTVMLLLSLGAMMLFSGRRLRLYGFTRGSFSFGPRILLWVLPTGVLATASALASPGSGNSGVASELTKLQLVVFVWVYASVCEEVLARGLLQTLLTEASHIEGNPGRRLSMPVVVSALFFGATHVVLLESMGPRAVPVIILVTLLGFVTARYRESTGSLLPAVITHALFNIGGMLPLWIISALNS